LEEKTREDFQRMLRKYLNPLHDWPINKIEAVHVFEMVLKPIWLPKPGCGKATQIYANMVYNWMKAKGAYPADKALFWFRQQTLPLIQAATTGVVRVEMSREAGTCRSASRSTRC
jgi:hypothetical protein